jgi:hypothetical protein
MTPLGVPSFMDLRIDSVPVAGGALGTVALLSKIRTRCLPFVACDR